MPGFCHALSINGSFPIHWKAWIAKSLRDGLETGDSMTIGKSMDQITLLNSIRLIVDGVTSSSV